MRVICKLAHNNLAFNQQYFSKFNVFQHYVLALKRTVGLVFIVNSCLYVCLSVYVISSQWEQCRHLNDDYDDDINRQAVRQSVDSVVSN